MDGRYYLGNHNQNGFNRLLVFLSQRGFPHTHPTQSSGLSEMEREKIYTWVLELSSPDTREHALLELRYMFVIWVFLLQFTIDMVSHNSVPRMSEGLQCRCWLGKSLRSIRANKYKSVIFRDSPPVKVN